MQCVEAQLELPTRHGAFQIARLCCPGLPLGSPSAQNCTSRVGLVSSRSCAHFGIGQEVGPGWLWSRSAKLGRGSAWHAEVELHMLHYVSKFKAVGGAESKEQLEESEGPRVVVGGERKEERGEGAMVQKSRYGLSCKKLLTCHAVIGKNCLLRSGEGSRVKFGA